MKRIKKWSLPLVLASTAALFFSCSGKKSDEKNSSGQKPNITLSGTFSNSAQETVVLSYLPTAGEQVVDSAKIDENGNFKFENLHIPGIGFYTLKIDQQNFAPLILTENQTVKVTGDAKNLGYSYKTEGSPDTKVFQEISEMSMKHKSRIDSLGADFQSKMGTNTNNKKLFEELSKQYEVIYNKLNDDFYKKLLEIINANPKSLACITAVAQLDPSVYIDVYKKLDSELMNAYPDYTKATSFHEQVLKYTALAIGSDAPEINAMDPSGKTITLSSLKGKVVMIDFWASWCKPCRRENPNVVKMYAKLKNKGLEILGVSLDENKDDWTKAIDTDGLTWNHVCDFGGWYSPMAKMYDVSSIPYTIVVDKNGRIVSKGLRGESLEKKISELLGS